MVLRTGSLDDLDEQGYFRIHLNQYDQIETITCISKSVRITRPLKFERLKLI